MRRYRRAGSVMAIAGILGLSAAGSTAQVPRTLMDFGQPIYPAFEGWYNNPDGTFSLLIGYFNANGEQHVDIPLGDANYFSPGPRDRGQPTRFAPGRHWGVFTIQVPADFGDGALTWHLTANEQPVAIPMSLNPAYYVEPFRDASNGNEPPTIRWTEQGEGHLGPPVGIWQTLDARVDVPVEISVWTSDAKPTSNVRENPQRQRPPLVVRYHTLRGPGEVEFGDPELEFEDSSDQNPTTTATFSEPGDYVLRIEVLDETGEGGSGFQCCWTSAHVRVHVE